MLENNKMFKLFITHTLIAILHADAAIRLFDGYKQYHQNIPADKNVSFKHKNNEIPNIYAQKYNVNYIDENQFYIQNGGQKNLDMRRASVLNWFKTVLLSTRTTTVPQDTAITKVNETDIKEILLKLTTVLENINNLILKEAKDGFLIIKMPLNNGRVKRDVNAVNLTVVRNNDTLVNKETFDSNNTVLSGRRSMSFIPYESPATEIKKKLLFYLDETFSDIHNKLQPLNNLKVILSDDNNYRIGYLTANIDTLQSNLDKMKVNMDKNKQTWDDSKILDLFDKLKTANKVITELLDSLQRIVPKY